jgi:hypothetical protein
MQYPLQRYIRLVISTPPRIIITKVAAKVRDYYRRKHDQRSSSFLLNTKMPPKSLNDFLGDLPQNVIPGDQGWLKDVVRHYLAHRFDLLGSGWVRIQHGMKCRGLLNHRHEMGGAVAVTQSGDWLEGRINAANLAEAQHIWSLIDADYCPIDWHLDFKSGYRWSEDTWCKDIKYSHLLGVDVKVPWELARMQHLPQLAWAYTLAQRGVEGFENPKRYAQEFHNQTLDFISTNPPRWGVNWACTMDVAIRVANWLVAYDLFKSFGAQFDEEFENVFSRSIYEHGQHIINNLEWSIELRSNHYLSDITGLLFASVYLPCNKETNAWLAFSVQELIKEVKMQFHEDGSNFEASTSYHRLSAELVVYATALILGLSKEKRQALLTYEHSVIKGSPELAPAPLHFYRLPNSKDESPFPVWYFPRLERMAEFTMHITKPNGHIPQFGDNDSGRFLKLFPTYERMTVGGAKTHYLNLTGYDELPEDDIYWMENVLSHHHLVAAINGLFDRTDFAAFAGDAANGETMVVQALCRGVQVASAHVKGGKTAAQNIQIGDISDWQKCEKIFNNITFPPVITRFPAEEADLQDGLETIAYPDFGLYMFRSKRLYLAIRCGSIGQNGNGGHAHNDQLSIELEIDGKTVTIDPGTYIYTAYPVLRNTYRSVKAHFAPCVGEKESGDLSLGAFTLGGNPHAAAIYFGVHGFVGTHDGYGSPVYRRITIEDVTVIVTDFSNGSKVNPHTHEKIPYSPAYGIITK